MQYTRLPAFKIDNTQQLVRFHRRLIEWSPSCKNIVEDFTSQVNDLKKIDSLTGACHVIAWISFGVSIVFGAIDWCINMSRYPGSEQFVRLYLLIARICLYIAQTALVAALYQRGKKIDGFYARIASEKCSDDFTNQSFTGFDAIINLYAVKRALVTLIVLVLLVAFNFFYEALVHCNWLILCKCAEVCRNQKESDRLASLEYERLKLVPPPVTKPITAPTLASRKEMAHVAAGLFMMELGKQSQTKPANVLNPPTNQNTMVPILG